MKKRGIINAQLSGLIAGLGHKDTFMIADGGMPIPKGVTIVDLALCGGVPTFQQVMDAVLELSLIHICGGQKSPSNFRKYGGCHGP